MFTSLFNCIENIVSLSPLEKDRISEKLKVRRLSKGEHLVVENQLCNELIFISNGFFRIYIQHMDGSEITIHLESTGRFITAFHSFISQTPSQEYLMAVTDADIITINHSDLQELYKWSHNLEKLGRIMVEKYFVEKEKRVISFIKEPGELRYKYLLENRPDLLLHIPLQYIASYLGMKPETLSRIRAKTVSSKG
ncbi:MAG TPA: Crp/Fnr family transcriptional regulator [Cytophagaceae bacterium]|jgi:CRP-like cAMP-binding protein